MNAATDIVGVLVPVAFVLVLTVGLFILLRKFVLWYWRVSEIVGHLSEIRRELKQIRLGSKDEPPISPYDWKPGWLDPK